MHKDIQKSMKFLETRRQFIFGIALLVFVGALVYAGFANSNAWKYQGLTLQSDVEMDEETRNILETRIATTQAAIDAQRGSDDIDLNLYTNLAFDAILMGDLVLARETYEEYFERNAINYIAWNNYANVLRDMGDTEKAEEAYRKAVELGGMEEYYSDLIDHIRKNDPDGEREDEVKALLEQDVEENGQSSWSMVMLAQWYMDHDDCERALDHYEVAVSLLPDNETLVQEYEDAKDTCAQR